MSDPIDTGEGFLEGLKDYSLGNFAKDRGIPLDSMDLLELLALRDEIDAKLPKTTLKDVNVEQEVLLQYIRVKELQSHVAQDRSVPTNQRAQVSNTVAKCLSEIVRMRSEVYNTEQFRLMEAALAKALKTLPEAAQTVFYGAYQKIAEEMADVTSTPGA